jgi:hypothetical protein
MRELRWDKIQCPIKQNLPRRRGDQIVAANDLRDPHGRIIDGDGELIRRRVVVLPNHEIADGLGDVQPSRATEAIDKRWRFLDAEPPAMGAIGDLPGMTTRTRPRVSRAFIACVRGTGGRQDIRSRTGTRIDEVLANEFFQCGPINRHSRGLHNRFTVPVESEPTKVFQGLIGRAGLDARTINVLDPQSDFPASRSDGEPGDEIGPSVADVLSPGGRRCQPTANREIALSCQTSLIPVIDGISLFTFDFNKPNG